MSIRRTYWNITNWKTGIDRKDIFSEKFLSNIFISECVTECISPWFAFIKTLLALIYWKSLNEQNWKKSVSKCLILPSFAKARLPLNRLFFHHRLSNLHSSLLLLTLLRVEQAACCSVVAVVGFLWRRRCCNRRSTLQSIWQRRSLSLDRAGLPKQAE